MNSKLAIVAFLLFASCAAFVSSLSFSSFAKAQTPSKPTIYPKYLVKGADMKENGFNQLGGGDYEKTFQDFKNQGIPASKSSSTLSPMRNQSSQRQSYRIDTGLAEGAKLETFYFSHLGVNMGLSDNNTLLFSRLHLDRSAVASVYLRVFQWNALDQQMETQSFVIPGDGVLTPTDSEDTSFWSIKFPRNNNFTMVACIYGIRKADGTVVPVDEKKLKATISAINPAFKIASNPTGVSFAQRVVQVPEEDFIVPKGQLTFDVEGTEERNKYFTRKAHHPDPNSGVTLGRGYDMKGRTIDKIITELTSAGLTHVAAVEFSLAGILDKKMKEGKKGGEADTFIRLHNLPEISTSQQKKLFIIAYQEKEDDVRRLLAKYFNIYSWEGLNPTLRTLLVDLHFRGDFSRTRQDKIAPFVINNDLSGFYLLISNRQYWLPSVPVDRFNRRVAYVKQALGL